MFADWIAEFHAIFEVIAAIERTRETICCATICWTCLCRASAKAHQAFGWAEKWHNPILEFIYYFIYFINDRSILTRISHGWLKMAWAKPNQTEPFHVLFNNIAPSNISDWMCRCVTSSHINIINVAILCLLFYPVATLIPLNCCVGSVSGESVRVPRFEWKLPTPMYYSVHYGLCFLHLLPMANNSIRNSSAGNKFTNLKRSLRYSERWAVETRTAERKSFCFHRSGRSCICIYIIHTHTPYFIRNRFNATNEIATITLNLELLLFAPFAPCEFMRVNGLAAHAKY